MTNLILDVNNKKQFVRRKRTMKRTPSITTKQQNVEDKGKKKRMFK